MLPYPPLCRKRLRQFEIIMWRTENETLECEASIAHRDALEGRGPFVVVLVVVSMVEILSSRGREPPRPGDADRLAPVRHAAGQSTSR